MAAIVPGALLLIRPGARLLAPFPPVGAFAVPHGVRHDHNEDSTLRTSLKGDVCRKFFIYVGVPP
ncbi:hypothetical protein [Nonomuraea sp. B12E4]|uniref:hypothetical protein n=1 Tax=Nonomuraea sp. B12E4 TaxID=3153564 RepID=UPI00325F9D1F